MKEQELSELGRLTDEELLSEAKKVKSGAIINALLIGFLIGIVVYSIVENSFGFLMLIPLFLAYRLMNNSKRDKALQHLLKERNLR